MTVHAVAAIRERGIVVNFSGHRIRRGRSLEVRVMIRFQIGRTREINAALDAHEEYGD